MIENEKFIYNLKNSWERKSGLIIIVLFSFGTYYSLIKNIIKETFNVNNVMTLNLIIPSLILFALILTWLLTTKRISFFRKGDLRIGVFLHIDENESESKIKKIIENVIQEIEKDNSNINVILYPINHIKSIKQLNRFLDKHSHCLDCALFAKTSTGKQKNNDGSIDDIIKIKKITLSGKFDINEKLRVFKTSVNLADELNIRNLNKKWALVESNSLTDKEQLESNFTDIIMFFSGIYFMYLNQPTKSLKILKQLYSQDDSRAIIDNKTKKIIGNRNFIPASRLNDILINLFITSSSNLYNENKTEEAYNELKECEELFENHPLLFHHYISLARFSYELNKYNEAKKYTKKAKQIKNYATEVYLNQGFFGVIDKNEEKVAKNYYELSKVYKHEKANINYTDIVSWLNNEKNKYDNDFLFDFVIGSLNLFYSDIEDGKRTLKSLLRNQKIKEQYPELKKLTERFIVKGAIKSSYFRRKNKKKRKNRRRKIT